MRRMENHHVVSMRNLAEFHHSPCQVGVLTKLVEALGKPAHPTQEIATVEHAGVHEPEPFEADVRYRPPLGIAELLAANSSFQSGERLLIEVPSGFLQP